MIEKRRFCGAAQKFQRLPHPIAAACGKNTMKSLLERPREIPPLNIALTSDKYIILNDIFNAL
jgi:hypothetical protein